MTRLLLRGFVALAVCGIFVGGAKADDIHLCATAAACTGNASTVQLTGSTTGFVYGKVTEPTPDQLFVVVMAPVADNSGNWNSTSSTLWNVLGITPTQSFPTLSSAICALEGGAGCNEAVTGFTAQSFNVKAYSLTSSWTGAVDTNPASFTLPGSPAPGDMYMAFVEDAGGNLVAVSPWSSSLLYTPEPGTISMLLIGLAGVIALGYRRVQLA